MRTDGQKDMTKLNCRFSQFLRTRLKIPKHKIAGTASVAVFRQNGEGDTYRVRADMKIRDKQSLGRSLFSDRLILLSHRNNSIFILNIFFLVRKIFC